MSTFDWSSFHCQNPDFKIKSIPDDVIFEVNRRSMERELYLGDMFSCCDTQTSSSGAMSLESGIVDLHEPAGVLVALLRLLHDPPAPPVFEAFEDDSEEVQLSSQWPRSKRYDSKTVIPLPLLLTLLYGLVDKYALQTSIVNVLNEHILAQARIYPLEIYGFATSQGMVRIASEASQYMMPLASYSANEIERNIPSAGAYHRLVRLQDSRVKALRALVLEEQIFPHGYGACPRHHQDLIQLWENKKKSLAIKTESNTDVAGEMATLRHSLPEGCQVCNKAYFAAVKMLAYKSRKTIRRTDQLPAEV